MLSSALLASVSVLESAPDAMVIVDAAGRILFASRRITSLCRHLPEEIVGHGIEWRIADEKCAECGTADDEHLGRVPQQQQVPTAEQEPDDYASQPTTEPMI